MCSKYAHVAFIVCDQMYYFVPIVALAMSRCINVYILSINCCSIYHAYCHFCKHNTDYLRVSSQEGVSCNLTTFDLEGLRLWSIYVHQWQVSISLISGKKIGTSLCSNNEGVGPIRSGVQKLGKWKNGFHAEFAALFSIIVIPYLQHGWVVCMPECGWIVCSN